MLQVHSTVFVTVHYLLVDNYKLYANKAVSPEVK